MAANPPTSSCPYKGLQPYTEADRAYFFGRERDQEIITANLYAAPLTVLYGASGVGKSSVLLAGVAPQLRQTPRLALVIFREWQDAGFLLALKKEVLRAVSRSAGKEINVDLKFDLDEFLLKCAQAFRGDLFFILDQFEEYFLYHPPSSATDDFDAEFARTINRQEISASFLLSMRDDGLSKLDRFQHRIPNLLNNMLRLEHLDRDAAAGAIRKPLEKYNRDLSNGQARMNIEDSLVEALLTDLRAGKVTLALAGQGQVSGKTRDDSLIARIETPFLQMVLTRLWEEEKDAPSQEHPQSQTLRLATYKRLGGATLIVRTHLDKVMEMEKLKTHCDTAASLFRFLVTPTGMKIAHTPGDLVSYTEQPPEQVESVLNLLSSPDVRILRPIAPPPGQPAMLRYEIFHDVLAPAILDWRTRFMKEQAQIKAEIEAGAEVERRLVQERAEAEKLAAEQRRQLELAQAQAETERLRAEEQQLLAEAKQQLRLVEAKQRSARQLKFGLLAISLLLLATLVMTFYAWREKVIADKYRAEAELARSQAGARVEELEARLEVTAGRVQVLTNQDLSAANLTSNTNSSTGVTSATPATKASPLTDDALRRIMPNLSPETSRLYLPYLQRAMQEFEINTPLRQAAFLAQLAFESGQFRWMEEVWGPTASQRRYEPPNSLGRQLGNTQPGDGERFKGRGAFQIVGRANYQKYGQLLGVDLVSNPELAATPEMAARLAAAYWKANGFNELADRESFEDITRRISGGSQGLPERTRYYDRAKRILGT